MFYWALLNLAPSQKYSLAAIQLLAVCKYSVFKNNLELTKEILGDFIDDLNLLQEKKMVLSINKKNVSLKGYLVSCLGDTPAQNWLGGYKETVSLAKKFCRMCEITQESRNNFISENIRLRTLENHLKLLEILEKEKNEKKKEELSTEFGINFRSPLLGIDNFD
ncbi:unnamed protein product, partial [Brachionus calyciflorus]